MSATTGQAHRLRQTDLEISTSCEKTSPGRRLGSRLHGERSLDLLVLEGDERIVRVASTVMLGDDGDRLLVSAL